MKLAKKELCTGCGACENACPTAALKMDSDKAGFLYPQINQEACIDCGKCERVCPIVTPIKQSHEIEPFLFMFQYMDENVRRQSTSGGAFTAIAEMAIKKGGVAFGASFDKNWHVHHKYVETVEELAQFRNSKYVQSEIGDTYKEAERFLKAGRWVVFSGTPCQIHGLIKFLDKDYDKLIAVDIACLGVPSPKIFDKYLELKDGKNIESIEMRNKDYGYAYPTIVIKYKDKKMYRSGSESDEWLRLFLRKYSIRNSCRTCLAQTERFSDFTLYDCNEIYRSNSSINDDKGTTNVIVHTQKAAEFLKEIASKHTVIKVDKVVKKTSPPRKSAPVDIDMDEFYDDLINMSAEHFFGKYAPRNLKIKTLQYGRFLSYKLGVYKAVRAYIRKKRNNKITRK